ncbi:23S rRNA (guanosine(2251)-2'-O)-methyltransferase RlmB [Olsenella sp. HMSC062G07]|uniref:23S rRNA (guanosine(2251)-2'-O)-methyltransferase RlmB n=1 Tax=Olsenella sp. HMSC062G07 TaxID=1739330 RepID=UPI0009F54848|nr:23S rRNA (guanosine(2251)-2'-O)-methyltransferase RlmB [Olsenella sp. HMSC062G07]
MARGHHGPAGQRGEARPKAVRKGASKLGKKPGPKLGGGRGPGGPRDAGARPEGPGNGRKGRPRQGGRRPEGRRPHDAPAGGLIEGRRAVAEALDAGIPLRRALVQGGADGSDATLARLVGRLAAADVPVQAVSRDRLDAMSSHGAHQGIVAQAAPFAYASLSDVIKAAGPKDALVVLLDHVTDEGNFGAIVRSAEVVGAAGVVIAKARAAGVGVGAYKTSAGAVMHLPIAQVSNLAAAIDQLKDAGFWVCGATEHAQDEVWSAPLSGRLCLVMGSEGEGISRLVRESCDFECRLPQRGRVESLNVAQATTVLCYEWLRRTMAAATERGADVQA